jgi:hypothetical protein
MKKTIFSVVVAIALNTVSLSSQAGDPVWLKQQSAETYDITVYRAESCGCCKGWIDHLKDHNFNVEDVVVDDVDPYKQKYGVPAQGASCHTAVVNGKVIEGHVPAQDIKKLLTGDSDIRLLTVPGMPSGGPGMDWEGARKDSFKVYGVSEEGKVSVFKEYQSY